MVIRRGRYGRFLACTNYPNCRNTREILKQSNGDPADSQKLDLDVNCDKCGKPLVLKSGRYGNFLACSGYPECKNTRQIAEKNGETVVLENTELEEKCPKCGANLVRKSGRFGEFFACGNYPECKYIKTESTGVVCPECKKGEIVVKKSRKGKSFYGCERYPECEFVLWKKPINEQCPDCGAEFLLESITKKSGTSWYCGNKECSFKKNIKAPGKVAQTIP